MYLFWELILGTVGFLTDLPLDKIEKLNEIIKGNYIKEKDQFLKLIQIMIIKRYFLMK